MKQHMLTHKIRDMSQHMFQDSPSSDSNNSLSASVYGQQHESQSQQNFDGTQYSDRFCRRSFDKKNENKKMKNIPKSDQSKTLYLSSDNSVSLSSFIQDDKHEQNFTTTNGNDFIVNEELEQDKSFNCKADYLTTLKSDSDIDNDTAPSLRENSIKKALKAKELCGICEISFNSKSALEIHMEVHLGFKSFVCWICEKTFDSKEHLMVIQITRHLV